MKCTNNGSCNSLSVVKSFSLITSGLRNSFQCLNLLLGVLNLHKQTHCSLINLACEKVSRSLEKIFISVCFVRHIRLIQSIRETYTYINFVVFHCQYQLSSLSKRFKLKRSVLDNQNKARY